MRQGIEAGAAVGCASPDSVLFDGMSGSDESRRQKDTFLDVVIEIDLALLIALAASTVAVTLGTLFGMVR